MVRRPAITVTSEDIETYVAKCRGFADTNARFNEHAVALKKRTTRIEELHGGAYGIHE